MRTSFATPVCRRPGFTLIELLVVIAIIGVLASLTISGVMTLREAQIKTFTETSVQKLASALDQQWKAALDQIRDDMDKNLPLWATQMAGGEPRRAQAIYLKARLKQEFPVTFDVAQNPVPGALTYKPAYKHAIGGTTSAGNQEWESAALLYLTLTQARRGMAAFSPDELDPSAIKTEGKFKIFVDSWGKPLRYYIFPIDNAELVGADPQDPQNTFQLGWSSGRPLFEKTVHKLPASGSRQLIPVIASAGRDGLWGLDQHYMTVLNADEANDNIYSYRLRQFGARGD
jgi:prepilin-type N-terminal cleavage/methylation domain-containing protein